MKRTKFVSTIQKEPVFQVLFVCLIQAQYELIVDRDFGLKVHVFEY